MGERVVGLEGQLKRCMVVSSDKEQWGRMETERDTFCLFCVGRI